MSIDVKKRSAEEIARGNDELRQKLAPSRFAKVVMTSEIHASAHLDEILEAVRSFDKFTEDNDPYGEHDMGIMDVRGKSVMFKIDYYDTALEYGEDPYESEDFVRVLTIMFSHER